MFCFSKWFYGFLFLFCVFVSFLREGEREHEVGWIGRWRGSLELSLGEGFGQPREQAEGSTRQNGMQKE